MYIALIVPPGREKALALARQAAAHLRRRGVTPCCQGELAPRLPDCLPLAQAVDAAALVCIGGDGTILYGAQLALQGDIPILGVSMGTLGFLADTQPAQLEAALDALLAGQCTEEARPLLAADIPGRAAPCLGLNDCEISRGNQLRLLNLQVSVDGLPADHFRADGVLVATPTGSTGYALSAGGPILSPGCDCLEVVPICAHSMGHRPLVVPGSARVAITLQAADDTPAQLLMDGRPCGCLPPGETVQLYRSGRQVRLLHAQAFDFHRTVRQKLNG